MYFTWLVVALTRTTHTCSQSTFVCMLKGKGLPFFCFSFFLEIHFYWRSVCVYFFHTNTHILLLLPLLLTLLFCLLSICRSGRKPQNFFCTVCVVWYEWIVTKCIFESMNMNLSSAYCVFLLQSKFWCLNLKLGFKIVIQSWEFGRLRIL